MAFLKESFLEGKAKDLLKTILAEMLRRFDLKPNEVESWVDAGLTEQCSTSRSSFRRCAHWAEFRKLQAGAVFKGQMSPGLE